MPDRAREVRLKEAYVSAQALGVQLQVVEARGPAKLDRAFLEISAKDFCSGCADNASIWH